MLFGILIGFVVYLVLGGGWLWFDERFHYHLAIYRRFPRPVVPLYLLVGIVIWPLIAASSVAIIVHNRRYIRKHSDHHS